MQSDLLQLHFMLIDFSGRKLDINTLCHDCEAEDCPHVGLSYLEGIQTAQTHILLESPVLASKMLSSHLSRISQLPKCTHSEHIKSLLCPSEST